MLGYTTPTPGDDKPNDAETPEISEQAQQALNALVSLQSAASSLFSREAERMAGKHGIEDPRAQRIMQTARGAQSRVQSFINARDVTVDGKTAAEKIREQREKQPPAPPPKPPREPKPKRESITFTLRGQVLRAEGKPAVGVLVRVYDKDVRYDDLLAAALTNRKGEFMVTYRTQDFAENETMADLYFVLVNASGKTLAHTANEVKFNDAYEADVELMIGADDDDG